MSRRALTILFCMFVSCPAWANTYYLAPAAAGGSDSNNGLSTSAPWLTPNHAVNCGDVITAAASASYSNGNFTSGKWGTVACSAGNNVAWLKCATFDACKSSGSGVGFFIDSSYWGVQGFEVTQTGDTSCFLVADNTGAATVHHVVFANDIASGCSQTGFGSTSGKGQSTDYIAFIGNIAYNSAQSANAVCGQGFSMYGPKASDSSPGTHLYIAGNFAWDNVDNAACNGGHPSDGEGLELDTFSVNSYAQQTVVENNMFLFNGGRGIQALLVNTGHVYVKNNTLYGNNTDVNQGGYCGEFADNGSTGTITLTGNLTETTAATGCNGSNLYDYLFSVTTSATITSGWGYVAAGNNYCTAFNQSTFNCFGLPQNRANPNLASPSRPGAPSCGSASNVPNCMATVIADFTPTNPSAISYGYQIPSATASNPLFPQWLCNVNLPVGLVTTGCNPAARPAPPVILSLSIL
jgi:hypothetical protein